MPKYTTLEPNHEPPWTPYDPYHTASPKTTPEPNHEPRWAPYDSYHTASPETIPEPNHEPRWTPYDSYHTASPKVSEPNNSKRLGRSSILNDRLIVTLHDVDKATMEDIGERIGRPAEQVQKRYDYLKTQKAFGEFEWTKELDKLMRKYKREKKAPEEIAAALDLPRHTIEQRIQTLWKRSPKSLKSTQKSEPVWSEEEEEILLRLYIVMMSDKEICDTEILKGKGVGAIATRRRHHLNSGKGLAGTEMYRKLLCAYRTPGREWTKEDVLQKRVTFGEWKELGYPD